MLNELKAQSNLKYTRNGALTHETSYSYCLDLFFQAGAMRSRSENDIETAVIRAFAEDPAAAMKILFFARDIRGGLGERRFFRTAVRMLAELEPDAVRRNIGNFAEYGRFDDLCALLGTPCEREAVAGIRRQLDADNAAMAQQRPASLLAKWLPSVNASCRETREQGRLLAMRLGMTERQYRRNLASLRRYTDILENRLRERDYTFDYSKLPSNAAFRYRGAFLRNDGERYKAYLDAVNAGRSKMHTATLYPYEIVRACLDHTSREERLALDTAWQNLPVYGASGENAIAVIDGSGSMYCGGTLRPVDVALSLGLYFAEHSRGAFAGHFITFSSRPRLVEIKGEDIAAKVRYCSSFNEIANTDLEAVFDLILETALANRLPQSELPAKLYIISDMEFDYCIAGGNSLPMFEAMRQKYAANGYILPQVVFWNVNACQSNLPVKKSETGAALVSGASASVFDLVTGGKLSPLQIMLDVINSERYARVA